MQNTLLFMPGTASIIKTAYAAANFHLAGPKTVVLQNILHLLEQGIWHALCLQHRIGRKPQPKVTQWASLGKIVLGRCKAGQCWGIWPHAVGHAREQAGPRALIGPVQPSGAGGLANGSLAKPGLGQWRTHAAFFQRTQARPVSLQIVRIGSVAQHVPLPFARKGCQLTA